MKKLLLTTVILVSSFSALPVHAEPIESVPLAPIEVKPITEAKPLDNVSQEDAPVSSALTPADDPSLRQPSSELPAYPTSNTQPIAPIVPYGGSIGTAPADKMPGPQTIFCTLKVTFASACCGIDNKTGERVKTYLDSSGDRLSYTRHDWGREGEYDYCLQIKDHKFKSKTYTALKKIITDQPVRNKPVTITGDGFAPVENAKPSSSR